MLLHTFGTSCVFGKCAPTSKMSALLFMLFTWSPLSLSFLFFWLFKLQKGSTPWYYGGTRYTKWRRRVPKCIVISQTKLAPKKPKYKHLTMLTLVVPSAAVTALWIGDLPTLHPASSKSFLNSNGTIQKVEITKMKETMI